jgi:toxin ParE1/3/4
MASYTLSRRAQRDLTAIYIYTASQFGRQQAVAYKDSMQTALLLLAHNPMMGRSVEHLRKSVRRHEHESHIIFYRPQGEEVFVLRILPCRADWKEHL